VILLALDQIGAGFRVLSLEEAITDRVHAAANPIAGFDDNDGGTVRFEVARGGETRETRTGDDDGLSC
jgi:hypothetical protein